MSEAEKEEGDAKSTSTDIDTPISCFWCDKESCQRLGHSFNRYWKLAAACGAVFLYVLLGGILFSAVERPSELRRIQESEAARDQAVSDLFDMLLNSTNVTEEEARNLTVAILALGRTAAEATRNLSFDANPIWDFSSAIFFSSTVITTIGYGSIAPSTAAGQILFMFYAILGIPLALIFLTVIGNIVEAWVARALRPVEQHWGALVSRAVGCVALISAVLVFFMLIPGAIFSSIETWSYQESVYYTVVTLTTVGFGDFVPAQATEVFGDSSLSRLYKIANSIWLWIGLALMAALISEIKGVFVSVVKWLQAHHCCRHSSGWGKGLKDETKVLKDEPVALKEVHGEVNSVSSVDSTPESPADEAVTVADEVVGTAAAAEGQSQAVEPELPSSEIQMGHDSYL